MWCAGLDYADYTLLTLHERILAAFSEMSHWGYAHTDADVRFPRARAHLPRSRVVVNPAAVHRTNCSSLTSYLLFTALVHANWVLQSYRDMQIMDPARPWSPITAAIEAGAGKRVDSPSPFDWHLCQKWKTLNPLRSGHARLVRALDGGDGLWVLEATNRNNLGVGYSYISWTDLTAANKEVQLVRLAG